MNLIAQKDHSTVFHVFFHSTPQTSLSLFCEFVSLVDDEHFESFVAFGIHIAVTCYLFDNVLDDVAIVVLIVRWSHFHVIVAAVNVELYCY